MSDREPEERDTPWDPESYLRFEKERAQPFHDLLALVTKVPGGRAVDLGCGTGDLTGQLLEATEARSVLGIDNAPSMLSHARPREGLSFEQQDIGRYAPRRPFDLVFSNAALQWLPHHESLFGRITEWVAPGGQLAVQMPANQHHISHVTAARIAEERFGCAPRDTSVLAADDYMILFDRLGFEACDVRVQVYLHHLPGPEALVAWVEGTLLNAYRARLSEGEFPAFLTCYREELLRILPREKPYRFTFPRILIHARRPA